MQKSSSFSDICDDLLYKKCSNERLLLEKLISRVYSAFFNNALRSLPSQSIVSLTVGSLLIPFQPSESPSGALSQAIGYPSNLRNFNNIRQQIRQRAQFLADLQPPQNSTRFPSFPIHSANTAAAPLPTFSSRSSSVFPSDVSRPPYILPLPVISSQIPYTIRSSASTSSSSTSSSSSTPSLLPKSSVPPSSASLTYSQPSFVDLHRGSTMSGLIAPYQSFRP
jgi:hypothetical protein